MVRRRRTAERSGKPGAVALWLDFGQAGFVERLLSNAHQDAWKVLEASGLQWTMICPGTMRDGVSNGRYRFQADTALPDMKGILYDDVAHLILECLERDLYVQQRVSVSNP